MTKSAKRSREWFLQNRGIFERLVEHVRATIRSLLTESGIPFVDVHARCKTEHSFVEKIKRKRYSDPVTQITDIAGVRVITLVESDVERVSELLKASFNIHEGESLDKSSSLGTDRFGYRSVHLICDLGDQRCGLPEFAAFKGLRFEVQVRTALQHAWAEIEHDRSYKLKGELPSHLKRRFSLLAGLLELADAQFDDLTAAIVRYQAEVAEPAKAGVAPLELNSSTLEEFIAQRISPDLLSGGSSGFLWESVIEELEDFGVRDISMLAELATPSVVAYMRRFGRDNTSIGALRDLMMFNDIDHYFATAWKKKWGGWDATTALLLSERWGEQKIRELERRFDIDRLAYEEDSEVFDPD